MIIRVTQEHIDHGRKRDCVNCPVSRTIRAARGDLLDVRVGTTHIYCRTSERDYRIWLPFVVSQFVWNYDSYGLEAKPFEFELDLP